MGVLQVIDCKSGKETLAWRDGNGIGMDTNLRRPVRGRAADLCVAASRTIRHRGGVCTRDRYSLDLIVRCWIRRNIFHAAVLEQKAAAPECLAGIKRPVRAGTERVDGRWGDQETVSRDAADHWRIELR